MEYPEEESEEEEYEEQNINAMRLQKCEKKSKDLWNVITDFIINTKQAKFEQKIGKFWNWRVEFIDRTLHHKLSHVEDHLYSPKKESYKRRGRKRKQSEWYSKGSNSSKHGSSRSSKSISIRNGLYDSIKSIPSNKDRHNRSVEKDRDPLNFLTKKSMKRILPQKFNNGKI